jgi:hypothetical protein
MVTVEELPHFPASIDEIAEEKTTRTIASLPSWAPPTPRRRGPGRLSGPISSPGHVAEGVIGLIKQLRADLLVGGFMGHSQLYERIIGGTTDRLARLAPCAVLVVK